MSLWCDVTLIGYLGWVKVWRLCFSGYNCCHSSRHPLSIFTKLMNGSLQVTFTYQGQVDVELYILCMMFIHWRNESIIILTFMDQSRGIISQFSVISDQNISESSIIASILARNHKGWNASLFSSRICFNELQTCHCYVRHMPKDKEKEIKSFVFQINNLVNLGGMFSALSYLQGEDR